MQILLKFLLSFQTINLQFFQSIMLKFYHIYKIKDFDSENLIYEIFKIIKTSSLNQVLLFLKLKILLYFY